MDSVFNAIYGWQIDSTLRKATTNYLARPTVDPEDNLIKAFDGTNLDYKEYMPEILGKKQIQWLLSNLSNSTAKFKIIVVNTPFANPVKNKKHFTFAEKERKAILDFLVLKHIEGVVVISANKDFAEITRFVRAGAYPLNEITAGPTTARPAKEISDMNYFSVPNSVITERSFVQVKIDGNENDRIITFSFINSKGKQLFSTSLKESELRGK